MRAATTTDPGKRASQQDEALIVEGLFGQPDISLYAVFDGHGSEGSKVSAFVKTTIVPVLEKHKDALLSRTADTLRSIVFADLHERLCENQAIDTYMSGTTAAVVIVRGESGESDATPKRIYVANLGDSRVILGRRKADGSGVENVALTTDHTCADPKEFERVKGAGARIEQLMEGDQFVGPLRIFKGTLPYPGLVCTRSLGDIVAKRLGIIQEAEVTELEIVPGRDLFLLLATDGVWDGLSNDEVANIVAKEYDAQSPLKASKAVTDASLVALEEIQVDDNTTNITVFF